MAIPIPNWCCDSKKEINSQALQLNIKVAKAATCSRWAWTITKSVANLMSSVWSMRETLYIELQRKRKKMENVWHKEGALNFEGDESSGTKYWLDGTKVKFNTSPSLNKWHPFVCYERTQSIPKEHGQFLKAFCICYSFHLCKLGIIEHVLLWVYTQKIPGKKKNTIRIRKTITTKEGNVLTQLTKHQEHLPMLKGLQSGSIRTLSPATNIWARHIIFSQRHKRKHS